MIWRYLPPQLSHALAPLGVKTLAHFETLKRLTSKDVECFYWKKLSWKGLVFKNPLGIAGGVDKSGSLYPYWERLGYGFCEVGTFTPEPQEPNPGKILDRDWPERVLWNKMGFPNAGIQALKLKLQKRPPSFPVFVNIGKNRLTPLNQAVDDYLKCIWALEPPFCTNPSGLDNDSMAKGTSLAHAFVINVSSPNTQGLRQLEGHLELSKLLKRLRSVTKNRLLIKLSPDLSSEGLRESMKVALDEGFEGAVLTNSTLQRPEPNRWPPDGGLSGRFLAPLSIKALEQAALIKAKKSDFLLISVGGILEPEDIRRRLELGADLCQIYSALVFKGPSFGKEVAKYFRRIETG
jgi:dihydroorotate dehydrogenase